MVARYPCAIAALCLVTAACGEPDFDQRYAESEKQLTSEAAALQSELDRRMSEKADLPKAAEAEKEKTTPVQK